MKQQIPTNRRQQQSQRKNQSDNRFRQAKENSAAANADEIFSKARRAMPHGLGHGIGLEIHEAPFVRQRAAPECVFKPGMIVTLEPGLYDPELGGVRLENDVLITESGNEVLTRSRIIVIE